ncbi:hypothetical protein AVEN_274485-1 [Araneus ventricosus]|uniref:Uncharacterized protein n=1 Tax=Araneus ventricosus TaxID=182803 RepID=A0A4Y2IL84_ARAVE|nr:hypothetical protein AVEN_274485-1 [Araneus ventricosus]
MNGKVMKWKVDNSTVILDRFILIMAKSAVWILKRQQIKQYDTNMNAMIQTGEEIPKNLLDFSANFIFIKSNLLLITRFYFLMDSIGGLQEWHAVFVKLQWS